MLDKLSLNKLSIILLLVLCSCAKRDPKLDAPGVFHTELICPGNDIILIRYSTVEEVKSALKNAYEKKKKFNTSESYTVISFTGNRSMKIDKIKPEDAINCSLRELYHPRPDKYKKKYTESPEYKFFTRH
jgi:hypothetical protein